MEGHRELKGFVVHIDLAERQVRLKEDDESICSVCCGDGVHVFEDGESRVLEGLRPGDYVRTECATGEDGRLLTGKIVLLRPAWKLMESPET
jgi:hypothetical protein